jgi:hypothetical protein
MSTPANLSLALAGASAAAAVSLDLIEHARTGTSLESSDVIENACDAAKIAIEATHGDNLEGDVGQVYGALCKFLEGWAG